MPTDYRWFYFIPLGLALLSIPLLTFYLLPDHFFNGLVVAIVPLTVLGFGFRFTNYLRVKAFRGQLYEILEILEDFDVDEPKKVAFKESPYPIFKELNEYLLELIERVRIHYQANKQFTQNASHELKTPLAIIKGHVELLLSSPNLREKEVSSLAIILQNTNRLTRLISALILLSKIENNRYTDVSLVTIENILTETLHNFHDILSLQEIKVETQYTNLLQQEMSATLADILFTNLIQNAIRYNQEEGFISIAIKDRTVTIANPGDELNVSPSTLFKRFRRQSDVEESLGLGLSIVQRICELYDIEVQYLHHAGLHRLVLVFPE